MVWVGLISYPLYLWHWPVLSFLYILNGGRPSLAVRAGAVVFSVVAAYLTYRLIELHFRNNLRYHAKNLCLVALALATLGVGFAIYLDHGMPGRAISKRIANKAGASYVFLPSLPAGITTCANNAAIEPALQQYCHQYMVKSGAPTVAVWGDSSSGAWSYMFYKMAEQHGFNMVLISHPSCPPLIGVRKSFYLLPESRKYCSDARLGETVLKSLSTLQPQAVALIGAWDNYSYYGDEHATTNEYITTELDADATATSSIAAVRSQLPLTIEALDRLTNVLVFNSWPSLLAWPNYQIDRLPFFRPSSPMPLKSAMQHAKESAVAHEVIASELASGRTRRTRVFDPAVKVCSTECVMSLDNIGLYSDTYHITSSGSALFTEDVWAVLGPMVTRH